MRRFKVYLKKRITIALFNRPAQMERKFKIVRNRLDFYIFRDFIHISKRLYNQIVIDIWNIHQICAGSTQSSCANGTKFDVDRNRLLFYIFQEFIHISTSRYNQTIIDIWNIYQICAGSRYKKSIFKNLLN